MQRLFQLCLQDAAFWVTSCGWVIISLWEGQNHKPEHTTKIGRRSDLLCFYGVGAALLLALVLKLVLPNVKIYNTSALFWLGLIFAWAGMALRHVAIKTLGKYHVMTISTQDKQPVITTGPYKYIRHPSYLGAIIAVMGIALSLNSLIGSLILTLFTVIVLVQRIQIEDRYLSEHLGRAYKNYENHTARLIPLVW